MSDRLPVHLDPVSMAAKGREIAGSMPVEAFERLADALHSRTGELEVSLRFGRTEAGRDVLQGRVTGELELVCQRCLAPYGLPVDIALDLVLVESEAEAETLPEEQDALVVGGRRSMHTVDMVEDDLILALPLVPRCGRGSACVAAVEILDSDAIETETGRQQPFAGLDG